MTDWKPGDDVSATCGHYTLEQLTGVCRKCWQRRAVALAAERVEWAKECQEDSAKLEAELAEAEQRAAESIEALKIRVRSQRKSDAREAELRAALKAGMSSDGHFGECVALGPASTENCSSLCVQVRSALGSDGSAVALTIVSVSCGEHPERDPDCLNCQKLHLDGSAVADVMKIVDTIVADKEPWSYQDLVQAVRHMREERGDG